MYVDGEPFASGVKRPREPPRNLRSGRQAFKQHLRLLPRSLLILGVISSRGERDRNPWGLAPFNTDLLGKRGLYQEEAIMTEDRLQHILCYTTQLSARRRNRRRALN
jgi:hypothetical protein